MQVSREVQALYVSELIRPNQTRSPGRRRGHAGEGIPWQERSLA